MAGGLAHQLALLLRAVQHVGASQRSHWKLVQAGRWALRFGRSASLLPTHEYALQRGNGGADHLILLPGPCTFDAAYDSFNAKRKRRRGTVTRALGRPGESHVVRLSGSRVRLLLSIRGIFALEDHWRRGLHAVSYTH